MRVDRVVVGISGSLGNLAALHAAVAQAQRSDAQLVAVLAWPAVGSELVYRRAPSTALPEPWRQQAQDRLVGSFAEPSVGHYHLTWRSGRSSRVASPARSS